MPWTPGFPVTSTEAERLHEHVAENSAADDVAGGGSAGAGEPAENGRAAQPPAEESFCIQCHSNGDVWDKDQQRYFVTEKDLAGDIHWQKGLRCQDCHGGDPTNSDVAAAHSQDAGFKAVKSPADVPAFCGNCHANIEYMRRYRPSPRTDQLAEYWTSGHGKALKATGDPKVATCISCHDKPHGSGQDQGKHGIRAVDDLESPVYRTHVAKTCAKCHADEKVMAGYQYHGQPLGPRAICRVAGERTRPGADGEGRPERGHLQQLPRKPRRRAAGSRLGGQRLRHLPREDRQTVRRYPHEASF